MDEENRLVDGGAGGRAGQMGGGDKMEEKVWWQSKWRRRLDGWTDSGETDGLVTRADGWMETGIGGSPTEAPLRHHHRPLQQKQASTNLAVFQKTQHKLDEEEEITSPSPRSTSCRPRAATLQPGWNPLLLPHSCPQPSPHLPSPLLPHPRSCMMRSDPTTAPPVRWGLYDLEIINQ